MRPQIVLLFVALTSAGALRAEQPNLAKPPQEAYGNEPSPTVSTKPVIMINKATEAELIQHQDIGSLYAQKIIAGRPYDGPEDFKKRSGLPGEKFDKVKDLLDF
jgi:DNA uptake protein ComE-like DNA-binding protein